MQCQKYGTVCACMLQIIITRKYVMKKQRCFILRIFIFNITFRNFLDDFINPRYMDIADSNVGE